MKKKAKKPLNLPAIRVRRGNEDNGYDDVVDEEAMRVLFKFLNSQPALGLQVQFKSENGITVRDKKNSNRWCIELPVWFILRLRAALPLKRQT